MEETGYIEIKIEGTVRGLPLKPADVDISEIKEIINDTENFLYPDRNDKSGRPHISYKIEDGCAKHLFYLPISAVLLFNGLIGEIDSRKNIDFLGYKRAAIIEKLQKKSKEKNYEITLSNSLKEAKILKINKDTSFINVTPEWINTELYLYGKIYSEGGLEPNFHIITKEFGKLTISASEQQLLEGEKRLYKIYGVKASGKQNIIDGKPYDLKLLEYIEYNPVFDKTELDILIDRASKNWESVPDVDVWLHGIREGY
ncbi:MAG: hypothetical protein HW421_2135 [Ignavibacteria bacterium]|nr:hypothetical protein [Ignavibacteria bacterium]